MRIEIGITEEEFIKLCVVCSDKGATTEEFIGELVRQSLNDAESQ